MIGSAFPNASSVNYSIPLPARAPVALTSANVNFELNANSPTNDDDRSCTGSASAPTAPAGKVCLYIICDADVGQGTGNQAETLADRAFNIPFFAIASAPLASIVLDAARRTPGMRCTPE